jgi:hypothetical protein
LGHNSTAYELTILPHALVDLSAFIDEFSPTGAFAIDPIAEVEVSIGVNVSTVPVVNVILELSLVDDVVDFLADALHSAIRSDLADDVFVEPTLAELETLVDGLTGIGYDILKLQWSQLSPFLLDGFQGSSRLVIIITTDSGRVGTIHVRWLVTSGGPRVIEIIVGHVERSLRFHNGWRPVLWLHRKFLRRVERGVPWVKMN